MPIPTPATGTIAAIGDALTAVANEVQQHEALKNDPAMQIALVIHRVQAALDKQKEQINDENINQVRLLVAAPDAGGTPQ